MKKIICLFIIAILLMSVCGCKRTAVKEDLAVLDEFTEESTEDTSSTPSADSTVIPESTPDPEPEPEPSNTDVTNDTPETDNAHASNETQIPDYANKTIVTDAKPYTEIQITDNLSNQLVYRTIEQLENDAFNLTKTVVFVGKKVDIESKQAIRYNSIGAIDNLQTDSTVEVITAYYGDIKPGDIIAYSENCAVVESDGKNVMMCNQKPIGYGEYLFILWESGGINLLLSEKYLRYYEISPGTGALEKAVYDKKHGGTSLAEKLYKKYVIDGDFSLDEQTELERALAWKKRMASNTDAEKLTLTEQETAKIKELVKCYNDLAK